MKAFTLAPQCMALALLTAGSLAFAALPLCLQTKAYAAEAQNTPLGISQAPQKAPSPKVVPPKEALAQKNASQKTGTKSATVRNSTASGKAAAVPGTEALTQPPASVPAPAPLVVDVRVLRGLAPSNLLDSGLLDYLAPYLTHETGLAVRWVSAGDSRLLELAALCDPEDGDADFMLADTSPMHENLQGPLYALEEEGRALSIEKIMRDSFVLVGPSFDPARVQGMDMDEALVAIARHRVPFASRGDASPVHKREMALWAARNIDVRDGKNGYVEVGQNMRSTLDVAAAMQAYTLTDYASYLAWSESSVTPLTVLVKHTSLLERQWSMVPLNSHACLSGDPSAKTLADGLAETLAEDRQDAPTAAFEARSRRQADIMALADWLAAPSTQKRIAAFTRQGKNVFSSLAHEVKN